jgi:hypothetical protein
MVERIHNMYKPGRILIIDLLRPIHQSRLNCRMGEGHTPTVTAEL